MTAISANATSLEEAARDFATYFGQPYFGQTPYVIRYEVGKATVSDSYPFAIAQNLVPGETTIYPIRIHWYIGGLGFRRSDFFLFQDSFGSWKHFYTHRPNDLPKFKSGPLFLMAASESESENVALITEEQRRALENWKRTEQAKIEATRGNRPWYDVYGNKMPGGAPAGSPSVAAAGRASPQPTPVPRAEKVQAQTAAQADQPAPKSTPVVPPGGKTSATPAVFTCIVDSSSNRITSFPASAVAR